MWNNIWTLHHSGNDANITAMLIVNPQLVTGSDFVTTAPETTTTETTEPETTVQETTTDQLTVLTDLVLFQLRLSSVSDCIQRRALSKLRDVTNTMVQVTEQVCRCGFMSSNILEERFVCFTPQSPHHVTYRAQINRTSQATTEQLVTFIQQWVMTSQSILIQGVQLNINRTCDFVISTFNDVECSKDTPSTESDVATTVKMIIMSRDYVVVTAIGSTAAAVLVVLIGVAIYAVSIIMWKSLVKKKTVTNEHYQL